jgi:DNA-directed RNA polymerase subunit RPC12/RpoP
MRTCPFCGKETVRVKRSFFQKFYILAVFKCLECDRRSHLHRRFSGVFHRYAECPQCGTRHLSKLRSVDKIDRLNRNPLRLLLAIVRAPLYHCTFCRLQFWDCRPREPQAEKARAARAGAIYR